jgi:hypothetical protein
MKILHRGYVYEEVRSKSGYDIERIKRTPNYDYRIVNGITYRITKGSDLEEVGIGRVLPTEDNEFYPEQIERYVEYIRNGGIIEPFPVEVSKLEYNLDGMLDFLDSNKEYEDEIYPEFRDTGVAGLRVYSLSNILIYRDEGEQFYEYRRLNPKANSLHNCFPYPDGPNETEQKILPFLTSVFEFFDEHAEYTLINQNHRLAALKELGIQTILIRK